ncbi:AAA family ATPase [Bradyrhizobium diazoefficiens]|nr:AAA family ATPase [Bradyrhizobium diazoefficiens]MBR0847112.1 AAA family ATPase [Bradyrhizobium diazoefficiens]
MDKILKAKAAHAAANDPEVLAKKAAAEVANRISNAADLQHQVFEEIRWIVPDYLAEGLSLLVGKPKVGKSWLALYVGTAVASGGTCLGKPCVEGDVLALMLEDNNRRLQRRMTKMLGIHKTKWPQRFQYATEWPRLGDGGLELIKSWIKGVPKPRLIIIDILERVRDRNGKKDASQYSGDYEALVELHKIATEHQLSILVLHHQRKAGAEDLMDTISGTGGLGGAADTSIILGKEDAQNFLYGRGRDIEEFNVMVQLDDHCRWQVLGQRIELSVSAEQALILTAMTKDGGPMNIAKVAAAVPSLKRTNVKNLLAKMHAAGIIERVHTGVYRVPSAQITFSEI